MPYTLKRYQAACAVSTSLRVQLFEYTGRKDNLSVFSFDEQDQNVKAWKQLLDMAFDFKEIYSAPTTKEMGIEINQKIYT